MAFIESHTVYVTAWTVASGNTEVGTSFDGPQWAISKVSDTTASLRGKDLTPAMDHGRRWRRKRIGGSSELWTVWVCDAAADGSFASETMSVDTGSGTIQAFDPAATDQARRAQYHTNRDTVMRIFYMEHAASGYDAPLKVVRKMADGASSHEYRLNYGEIAGALKIPDYKTFGYSEFPVTIKYPDARWYGCNASGVKDQTAYTDADPSNGDPGGTALNTRMTITLTATGAITNPFILNGMTGSKLSCTTTLATGDTVVFDTDAFTAVRTPSGGSGSVVTGSVNRTGSSTIDWFQLRPNVDNNITTSSNTTYSITYAKAYI